MFSMFCFGGMGFQECFYISKIIELYSLVKKLLDGDFTSLRKRSAARAHPRRPTFEIGALFFNGQSFGNPTKKQGHGASRAGGRSMFPTNQRDAVRSGVRTFWDFSNSSTRCLISSRAERKFSIGRPSGSSMNQSSNNSLDVHSAGRFTPQPQREITTSKFSA